MADFVTPSSSATSPMLVASYPLRLNNSIAARSTAAWSWPGRPRRGAAGSLTEEASPPRRENRLELNRTSTPTLDVVTLLDRPDTAAQPATSPLLAPAYRW